MPRKAQSEKVNESPVEKPATRRSVRLSASSYASPAQQTTRAGSRSSSAKASPSPAKTAQASPKNSGKKGSAEKKGSAQKTSTPRGRGRGKKPEPEESEEEEEEDEEVEEKQQEESEEPTAEGQETEDLGKGKKGGQQGGRKGKAAKEKDTKESPKKDEASEDVTDAKPDTSENQETPSSAGRPKRGKQAATPVSEKVSTPRRCGRSRTCVEETKSCDQEQSEEADSSPGKGEKRKRESEDGPGQEAEADVSPKKSKPETASCPQEGEEKMEVDTAGHEKEAEDTKPETTDEKMQEDDVVDGSQAAESAEKKAEESISGEKQESQEEIVCSTSRDQTGATAAPADAVAAADDVTENGLAKEVKDSNPDTGGYGSEAAGDATTTETPAAPAEVTLSNGIDDVLLARKFVWLGGEEPSQLSQSFSVVSYNILADCHAQRDFAKPGCWITKEHLAVDYRHKLLMKELSSLNGDIICLQEVEPDYFASTLKPALAELGYDGLFFSRQTDTYIEGEATFYRTKCFTLEASQSLVLSQVMEKEIEESDIEADMKSSVKAAVDSYAVTLLTRFKCLSNGATVTCANIHVAFDFFERQDKQCLQLVCAIRELVKLAGGPGNPHFICGDFNSWPDSPPYQLVRDGHLSDHSLTALQSINCVKQSDGQMAPLVNYWSEGFVYSPADDLRSSYMEVQAKEPISSRFNTDGLVRSVDYLWFSSNTLEVKGVLETVDGDKIKDGVPNVIFPSDHLSLKVVLSFK